MGLTPKDMELPNQFTDFRPGQLETASQVASSSKYLYMLDSPTGTGKSLIGATIQRILEDNVIYVATTKQLQDQLLADFPYAKTVKGRNNYPCLRFPNAFPKINAETCTNTKDNPCPFINRCPYAVAKMEALHAPIAVLNTAYFLHEANHVGVFSGAKFLIMDEFDTVEDMLMSYIEVTITQRMLDKLKIPPPKLKTKFESWVEWAREAYKAIMPEVHQLEEQLGNEWLPISFEDIRRYKSLTRLQAKLQFFIKEVDKTWIWYQAPDRWTFKPIWIAKYSRQSLWRHAQRVLGMSATILDDVQMARNIGIESDKYQYKCLPSPFPKENRTVYYDPCANVVNKNINVALPALAKKVKELIDKYPDDKILIHTVSYKITSYIMNNVKSDRLITHTGMNRAQMLDAFKKSYRPQVLVSPSMDRGVDLPYDQCRVVIIAKVPYPDLGDKQVQQRVYASKDGNNWYAHKAVSKIIQMSGRATRSAKDYSETFILDEQFKKIYNEHRRLFPKWWAEALVM